LNLTDCSEIVPLSPFSDFGEFELADTEKVTTKIKIVRKLNSI